MDDKTVTGLLERTAATAPEALALRSPARSLTYAALLAAARRQADGLRRAYPQLRAVVIWLTDPVATVELVMACALAGAIAVPVEPSGHPTEVLSLLGYAGAQAVVTDRGELLPGAPVLDPQQLGEATSTGPLLPPPEVTRDTPALLAHTSGTTGQPKRVLLSHGSLVSGPHTQLASVLDPGVPGLLLTPVAFALGFFSVFAAISARCPVIWPPATAGPALLMEFIRQERPAWVCGPPHALEALAALQSPPEDRSSLKFVLVGGAPVAPGRWPQLVEGLAPAQVYSVYGLTEASGVTLANLGELMSRPGTAGQLLPGVEVRIVDEDGQEVPAGAVGELWVRTEANMLGYLGRPEATASTMSPDGFVRTGDLARQDEEGFLYIVGRRKRMILCGGLSIYAEQVESVILGHPEVAAAVVVSAPDPVLGEVPRALVETRPGSRLTGPELLEYCLTALGPARLPRSIEFVSSLLRGPTGKIRA